MDIGLISEMFREEEWLTKEQCFELMEIFNEEQIKFLELEEKHPKDVLQLYLQRIHEFYKMLGFSYLENALTWDKWNLYVSERVHTPLWKEKNNYNLILKEYNLSNRSNLAPVLRTVKPIFTKSDLKNLKPI